ncbi:MAG: hypothetical protein KBD24_00935 [Candidatus Pacebacteria bacterium]|nr:hypothetical protein [Candidatus Paceibacterota bacterium]
MTPGDENILATLNLLVFLHHARKENNLNLSEEEKHLILVKQEYLNKGGISLPVFHNTLKILDKKGYLMGVSIVDDDFHEKVKGFTSEEGFGEILSKIPDVNVDFFTPNGKQFIADLVSSKIPPQYTFDVKAFEEEKITIKEVLEQTRDIFQVHNNDLVSYVILLPFRSIEKLLEKMNDGRSFEEIQDSDIWYNRSAYEFHIGDVIVPVSYQGKPNIEHDVLLKLTDSLKDGVIWFDEINTYKPRSLKDALTKFVNKNEKLSQIFTVHSNRLEFRKDIFN